MYGSCPDTWVMGRGAEAQGWVLKAADDDARLPNHYTVFPYPRRHRTSCLNFVHRVELVIAGGATESLVHASEGSCTGHPQRPRPRPCNRDRLRADLHAQFPRLGPEARARALSVRLGWLIGGWAF